MKFTYNMLVYGDEPLEKGIERSAKFGYDGVEFVGEPGKYDFRYINTLLDKYGLEASSICSIFTDERDLVSNDSEIRKNALNYVNAVIDMAKAIHASVVIVRPSPCMKTTPLASQAEEMQWAIENIRECGIYAGERDVILVIEAWNRYETYFVNRLDEAIELCNQVALDNVGVMGDTFHMNIEEVDMALAIKNAGKKLMHIHLADSNRAAPGRGHIDFQPIVHALKEINYSRYISFELLPAAADPFRVLRGGGAEEFFNQYTMEAIQFMKKALNEL